MRSRRVLNELFLLGWEEKAYDVGDDVVLLVQVLALAAMRAILSH